MDEEGDFVLHVLIVASVACGRRLLLPALSILE